MDTEATLRLFGGARLSPGGLHLGHWFGTLRSIEDFPRESECIFVIKDTEPFHQSPPDKKLEMLLDMCADLLASPFESRLKITTASRVLRACPNLYNAIVDSATYNSVVSTHVRKAEIRAGQHSASVRHFLYPIDEAAIMLSLRTRFFLSNDDNRRLILVTRDVCKRIKRRFMLPSIPLPELRHSRDGGRLLGLDYRRMCKGNANVISMSEPEDSLYAKCQKATSQTVFFNWKPRALQQCRKDPHMFSFSDDYLPFYYQRVVCSRTQDIQQLQLLSKLHRPELTEILFRDMNAVIQPMRIRKKELLADSKSIVERVRLDTATVVEMASKWDDRFRDATEI